MDTSSMIFTFGSNLKGVHGAGAAKYAYEHKGAIRGIGWGLHGMSFAIPTKDHSIQTMPIKRIQSFVGEFIKQASNPYKDQQFQVTCIGCGLAGLKHEDIAPMFRMGTKNLFFDDLWKPWLEDYGFSFWGTH